MLADAVTESQPWLRHPIDGEYKQVARLRFGKREANPKPLSILDVLTMDGSDLSLLLQSNSPSTSEATSPLPPKNDNDDKTIKVIEHMSKREQE